MNALGKPAKHSAPGQYLGFALQPVRLCYHLLTCPKGARVSLEHLDDVAVHYANGSVLLEQIKSAQKQNPVSDLASDLWKAFSNWLGLIDSGGVDVSHTKFRLYVTPQRSGPFVQALSDATTPNEIDGIILKIEKKAAKASTPPACSEFLRKFLDAPRPRQIAVVQNFALESSDSDPVEPFRRLLNPTIGPEHVDVICQAAIGMAKQQADRLIQAGQPAILDGDSFVVGFRAFLQKNLMPTLLTSFTEPPPEGELRSVLQTRPIFIRQLELIEASEEQRLRAIGDFLRTSADKADWAERGLIFEGSLREWDDDLVRRHGLIAGQMNDLHSHQPSSVRGRLAYRACALMQAPLDGRAVPGHFVHGSFNSLADVLRLGWHPDYAVLLEQDAQ